MAELNVGEAMRRGLLSTLIAELFEVDPATINSPVCPMCDEGPLGFVGYMQAICGNEGCPVLMWNPQDTPEQYRQKATPLRAFRRNPDGTTEEVDWP